MFLRKLFAKPSLKLSFSPDLPLEERTSLVGELKACAEREGGALKNARRAHALTDLFWHLSEAGRRVFAEELGRLNDVAGISAGERYSQIEEAELFGGSDSKLGLLDLFETPRRRVLGYLSATATGKEVLRAIGEHADADFRKDIADIAGSGD